MDRYIMYILNIMSAINRKMWGLCALLACVVAMVACDDDEKVSRVPQFSGFRIEPMLWQAGDSVTITAVQLRQGDLLYKAAYTWRVSVEDRANAQLDTVFVCSYSVVYDNDRSNPVMGFRIPAQMDVKQFSIGFTAQYHFSANMPTEFPAGVNDGRSGVYGTISPSAPGQLSCTYSGNYSYRY